MSQENVEIVRAVYAADGTEAALAFCATDIEWDFSDRVFNPRVYWGHDGVREWSRELNEVWANWRNEPERFVDGGDHVVAIVRSVAQGKESGLELAERWAQTWTVRDGKIVHVRHYRDPAEALEAVGLRE